MTMNSLSMAARYWMRRRGAASFLAPDGMVTVDRWVLQCLPLSVRPNNFGLRHLSRFAQSKMSDRRVLGPIGISSHQLSNLSPL